MKMGFLCNSCKTAVGYLVDIVKSGDNTKASVYEATLPYVNVHSMFRYVQNGAKNRLRSKCNSLSFLYKTGVSMILENICDEVIVSA